LRAFQKKIREQAWIQDYSVRTRRWARVEINQYNLI